MRFIFAIALLSLVTSCSAPKLYQQGVSKIKRAIEKDSTLAFPTDTLRYYRVDTIPGKDGEATVIHTTETVEIPCEFDEEAFKHKTRKELRSERISARNTMKHRERMYRLKTKRLDDSLSYLNKLNKQLTKQLDDQTDADVKIAKEETKQKKGNWFTRQMGKIWWLLLIIGFVLRGFVPKIPFNIKLRRNGET